MKSIVFSMAVLTALGACAVPDGKDASPQAIAASAYRAPGPATLTIFTMVNNRTGSGGHTALMINGSQRVIFDPAGSFRHETVPEKNDVLYGITPNWVSSYKSAHARDSFHVVTQEIEVTPEQAERALQLAQTYGPVAAAYCTNSTTRLLRDVPGFENVGVTFFPVTLMEAIAQRPDVRTDRYYENDAGDVLDGLASLKL
ncbi:hypothetical protein [Sulfitobacter sabulilitoris]|uniref:Lipoprotein n=1 Tax=Sulfitobacter sabulilitoris TaxID=2562655 RepID=A0A5S3PPJ3_9RHOB|nr:hypothetical protein [Sulfitobacter sabulilitoris]TMM55510.1 hypothetical protein FDT80_08150 [Sulfitobacter sabulilitoris]